MDRLFLVLFVLLFVSCNRENEELPAVVNEDFTIEVTEVTTGTVKATITPKDKDMFYIAQVDLIYDHNFDFTINEVYPDSDNVLLNIGVTGYIDYAKDNGIDIFEFLEECNLGGRGTIQLERTMLEPGRHYGIVVIGVEYDESSWYRLKVVTPTTFEVIKMDTALNKDISFETNVTLDPVVGSDIFLDVKPQGWNSLYYYKFYERNKGYDSYEFYDIENYTPDEQFEHYEQLWHTEYERYIKYNDLEGLEALLRANTLTGDVEDKRFQLKANSEYCLVLYAMDVLDGVVQLASYPHTTYFTTSIYEDSDITFDVEIGEVNSRRVVYEVTPSSDMEGYCSVVMPVAEYNDWDEELLKQRIADQCVKNGVIYFGHADYEDYTLTPDTDYYVVCLGCHGEVATSVMTTIPFRTEPKREADSKIEGVEICGPFNATALYRYDPVKYADCYDIDYDIHDYCAVGVAVSLSQEPRMIYATFLFEDQTRGKSDEEIIDMLRNHESYSYNHFYFWVKYNVKGRLYALVMDEDGDIDFYASPDEYLFTRDNVLTSTEDVARLAEIYDQALAYYEGGYNASTTAEQAPEAMCLNAL